MWEEDFFEQLERRQKSQREREVEKHLAHVSNQLRKLQQENTRLKQTIAMLCF